MTDSSSSPEGNSPAIAKEKPAPRAKKWRAWLRAIHRDIGYLAVGFTLIYAISGIAVNHIGDWDPKFTSSEGTRKISPIPADVPDDQAIAIAVKELDLGEPTETYRAGDEIRLKFGSREATIIGDSGDVTILGGEKRFFFHIVVWLHTARAKPAWKYVADIYAVMLLYLAISGLFMIKGRLGLRWRGTILVTAGVLVPVLYVVLSGGPSGASDKEAEKQTNQSPG